MGELIHLGGQKTPRLVPCAVLFLDLLGVRAMTQGSAQDVQKRLVALDDVVGGSSCAVGWLSGCSPSATG